MEFLKIGKFYFQKVSPKRMKRQAADLGEKYSQKLVQKYFYGEYIKNSPNSIIKKSTINPVKMSKLQADI